METVETLEDGNRDEEQEEIEVMKEIDVASAGTRKRKVGSLDSSKHLVQYKTKWESVFPWFVPKKDTCKVVGMLCSLCMRHKCTGNHSMERDSMLSTTTPQCGARLMHLLAQRQHPEV